MIENIIHLQKPLVPQPLVIYRILSKRALSFVTASCSKLFIS